MYEEETSPYNKSTKTPAGFWIRVLANLIDGIVLAIPIGIIQFILLINESISEGYIIGPMYIFAMLISFTISISYYGFLTSSKKQGTLGKMVVGIKVIGANGEKISFGRAVGRFFATYLSGIFYIGYIMVGLTNRKRGLHDFIADTYVVYQDK